MAYFQELELVGSRIFDPNNLVEVIVHRVVLVIDKDTSSLPLEHPDSAPQPPGGGFQRFLPRILVRLKVASHGEIVRVTDSKRVLLLGRVIERIAKARCRTLHGEA